MHICTGYLPTICFYKYLCKYADVFNFFFSKWLTHFYEKAQSHEYTEYNVYIQLMSPLLLENMYIPY